MQKNPYMKLKIIKVHGHGDAREEYVFLRALDDVEISNYLLADSTYGADGSVSNKVRHTFWFPKKLIKKGEYISVRSRIGKPEVGKASDGKVVHRFYWGLKESVWNDDGDVAVLLEISCRQALRAKDAAPKK